MVHLGCAAAATPSNSPIYATAALCCRASWTESLEILANVAQGNAGGSKIPRLASPAASRYQHLIRTAKGGQRPTPASLTGHNDVVHFADESYRTARRVTLIGIVVSGLLACSNIVIGLLAQSTSVVATGLEFAGDVLASGIVFVGMRVAARPPDENHPYGHGRVETLAAFIVGVILAVAGLLICYRSLQAIGARHAAPGWSAFAALLAAIALRTIMSVVKFRVGRRIRSSALLADAWNDAVDILSALGALTAITLAAYDPVRFLAADHYGGF
ncbi:MAG: cation diffusion facilitator family transporter, partial [Vicinamibacterales bacterium]